MAKTGIRYAVFATATVAQDGTISYSNGKWISPVAGFNGAMNVNSQKDWGDDKAVDEESGITGGTLTVELNRDEDDIYTFLLGHEKAESGDNAGEVIYNADDVAPFIGVGAVGKSGSKWVGKWYSLVKFHEPNDDNSTKQETITFNHVSVEGEILIPEDGNWKKRKVFDTEALAKAWIDNLAGISA